MRTVDFYHQSYQYAFITPSFNTVHAFRCLYCSLTIFNFHNTQINLSFPQLVFSILCLSQDMSPVGAFLTFYIPGDVFLGSELDEQ